MDGKTIMKLNSNRKELNNELKPSKRIIKKEKRNKKAHKLPRWIHPPKELCIFVIVIHLQ